MCENYLWISRSFSEDASLPYIFNENVTISQVFFTHIASADQLTGFSMSSILAVEWLIDCNFRYVIGPLY